MLEIDNPDWVADTYGMSDDFMEHEDLHAELEHARAEYARLQVENQKLRKENERLKALLPAESVTISPSVSDTHDRFFPNQDTVPKGGFGNLIALPLQHGPRALGNSVFLDESFRPYPDQWGLRS